jgi:hypothetical protein
LLPDPTETTKRKNSYLQCSSAREEAEEPEPESEERTMTTLKLTEVPGPNEAGAKVLEDVIQKSSEQKETSGQGFMRTIARYDGAGVAQSV